MVNLWGKLVFRIGWLLTGLVSKLFFRLRIKGREHVPRKGPVLIVSNHVSHLDPPLVGFAVPRIAYHMAKIELFKLPFLLWFLRTIGAIIVNRGQGKQALFDAIKYMQRGECVVIFPEGTRSKSGRLTKGHSGAIIIAIQSGCTVVPCAIIGSEKAMTKGSRRIRFVPVTVRFGKPYHVEYDGDRDAIPRDVLRKETYKLMERIEELLPEHMRPDAEQKRSWYGDVAAHDH